MAAPSYLWAYIVYALAAISFVVLGGVATALKEAGYPRAEVRHGILWTALLLAGWIALTVVLGSAGTFAATLTLPGIRLGIGGAIAFAFGFAVMRTPTGARIIHAIPQSWLIGVQLFRGLGSIFLVLYGVNLLPGAFALPAGFGDVSVALLALPVAAVYLSGSSLREPLVIAWNIFGLADLFVAVTMGVLTTPALHLFPGPSSEILASWPLIMVPLFAVPLSIVLHIASLTKLAWDRELALHAHA